MNFGMDTISFTEKQTIKTILEFYRNVADISIYSVFLHCFAVFFFFKSVLGFFEYRYFLQDLVSLAFKETVCLMSL